MTLPIMDLPHWNLYRSLEDDLETCFKYVRPDTKHDDVTLDEFSKIILIAASEFENILNELAILLGQPCKNINDYYGCFNSAFPNATALIMGTPRYSRNFAPLLDWTATSGPDWWSQGYNKIKHNRLSHPDAPTLKRALFAVASVQLVLFYLYKHTYGSVEIPTSILPNLIEPKPINNGIWIIATTSDVFELP